MKTEYVLCCLDSDPAGASEVWRFWQRYPGFKRCPCVAGKDPGEQYQPGISTRKWIEAVVLPSDAPDKGSQDDNLHEHNATENGMACLSCGGTNCWESNQGREICRVCHPPASGAEKALRHNDRQPVIFKTKNKRERDTSCQENPWALRRDKR